MGKRRPKPKAATPSPAINAPMPDGIAMSLARILRPAAAYRWLLPHVASITPQYIEMVLRGALAGNHVQQWELFDLMLDTWPELSACQQELRDGVMGRKRIFESFADEDEDPTPEAQERCKLVSVALRRMQPNPAADENALGGTLADIIDGWFRGVSVLETDWHTLDAGALGNILAPRATYWVHPTCYGWDQNGRLGLRMDASGATGLGSVTAQPSPAVLGEFPPHKFLVGIHKAKSGNALGGALLRPLAWWWCAANFSADWLLNLAQIFGMPFRWANYDPTAPQETVDRICNMLQNMGSAGWAAFPSGTTLELKDTNRTGDHSPQGELLDRADRYARLVILGQTMSGSQDASKGGGKAFGAVEADVKEQRINAAASYAEEVLNNQLIRSVLILNYGNCEEAPKIRLLTDEDADLNQAQRDKVLVDAGLDIPKSYFRRKYGIPAPAEGEEVVGGKTKEPEESEHFEFDDSEVEEEAMAASDGKFHGNQWTGPVDVELPDDQTTASFSDLRKKADEVMKSFEPVNHPELGQVHFSRQGRKKTLSHKHSRHGYQAVAALPQLIERGKIVQSVPDREGRPEIKAFHTLEAKLRIGRTDYRAEITIKTGTDGEAVVNNFYLHRLHPVVGKQKTSGPKCDPAVKPDHGPAGKNRIACQDASVNRQLQAIAAIEDDAAFQTALKELVAILN